MTRIYYPSDLVTSSHPSTEWHVGFNGDDQMVVVMTISKASMQRHELHSLLVSLSSSSNLSAFWSNSFGPLCILPAFQFDDDDQQSPTQIVYFSLPTCSRYFDFDFPINSSPSSSSSSSPPPPATSLSIALRQINACDLSRRILRHALRNSSRQASDLTWLLMVEWGRVLGCRKTPVQYLFDFFWLLLNIFSSPSTPLSRYLNALLRVQVPSPTKFFVSFFDPSYRRVNKSPPASSSSSLSTVSSSSTAYALNSSSSLWVDLSDTSYALRELSNQIETRDLESEVTLWHEISSYTLEYGVQNSENVQRREQLWQLVSARLVDVALAIICASLLLAAFGIIEVPQWMIAATPFSFLSLAGPASGFLHQLQSALDWLLSSSAPAGLKLNPRLHAVLGGAFRTLITEQYSVLLEWIRIVVLQPTLAAPSAWIIALAIILSLAGFKFALGLAMDALWILSIPLRLFHATLCRFYSVMLSLCSSLLLLFRGKKRNTLRTGRIDSLPAYDDKGRAQYERLVLGTLFFVLALLLMPTIIVWYLVVCLALFVAGQLPHLFAQFIAAVMTNQSVVLLFWWLLDAFETKVSRRGAKGGVRIPQGVWMEIVPHRQDLTPAASAGSPRRYYEAHNSAPVVTSMQLHCIRAPFSIVFARYQQQLVKFLQQNQPGEIVRQFLVGAVGKKHS